MDKPKRTARKSSFQRFLEAARLTGNKETPVSVKEQKHSNNSKFVTIRHSNESIVSDGSSLLECPLCFAEVQRKKLFEISSCGHKSCLNCLSFYLRIEISESRVDISCPQCPELIHPNEIESILNDKKVYEKYERFMVRRVLATNPDTRWCPAPNCGYAVIASGCADCPKLKCERPGCKTYFCYQCKSEWHKNQPCQTGKTKRLSNVSFSSTDFSQKQQGDIKKCPSCRIPISKMGKGTCNHMTCSVCGAEFCWLCMRQISDLHYLSPSGCTFWGKRPWSRKKRLLWQLGILIGAPVGVAIIAGIAIPAMVIGIPVFVGRQLYLKYRKINKHKRNAIVVGGAMASFLFSPVMALVTVGIGVVAILLYIYGVVPLVYCGEVGMKLAHSKRTRFGKNENEASTDEEEQLDENKTAEDGQEMQLELQTNDSTGGKNVSSGKVIVEVEVNVSIEHQSTKNKEPTLRTLREKTLKDEDAISVVTPVTEIDSSSKQKSSFRSKNADKKPTKSSLHLSDNPVDIINNTAICKNLSNTDCNNDKSQEKIFLEAPFSRCAFFRSVTVDNEQVEDTKKTLQINQELAASSLEDVSNNTQLKKPQDNSEMEPVLMWIKSIPKISEYDETDHLD